MDNTGGRTVEMLLNDITWNKVAERLGISRNTLYVWRNGKDKARHTAVESAIDLIIKDKEEVK